jgi:hypothetical protein
MSFSFQFSFFLWVLIDTRVLTIESHGMDQLDQKVEACVRDSMPPLRVRALNPFCNNIRVA